MSTVCGHAMRALRVHVVVRAGRLEARAGKTGWAQTKPQNLESSSPMPKGRAAKSRVATGGLIGMPDTRHCACEKHDAVQRGGPSE
eukprot:9750259-Alexandrium_andersonii.AAC.1